MSIIDNIPKPLLDDLVSGKWLPVIGAGMSRNAIVPSGQSMPLWNDLGKRLAEEMEDYPYSGALDAISAYEHEYGRPKLIERLTDLLLIHEAQPGYVHRAFCSIPFDLVVTTNFDFLLERQYEATPRYCRPVIDEDQLSVNVDEPALQLLKLHADLHHPTRLVVTEADYDGFLADYPLLGTYLANLLITRTAVFIGYSLDDPDFRQVWHVVTERLGKTRRFAYALTVGARGPDIARFDRRGVKVINLPGSPNRYSEILSETFNALREYVRENVISVSHVTEEEPLRELSLPRDATTRLCFFALPLDLQPFYRERVFPLFRRIGFVPMTADDVVSPGDNIAAKIDALIDRAVLIVVEPSSPGTLIELRMAVARALNAKTPFSPTDWQSVPKQVLVITGNRDRIPADLQGVQIFQRPDPLKEDPEPFLADLEGWLRTAAQDFAPRISDEPQRLIQAREYRAAVIAAVSLLEVNLRRHLQDDESLSRRAYSIRHLLQEAMRAESIPAEKARRLKEWLYLRNEVVHSNVSVSRKKAQEIVDGIMEIIQVLG